MNVKQTIVILGIVLAMVMMVQGVIAQPPTPPATIEGDVVYAANGTRVPNDWVVNVMDATTGFLLGTGTTNDVIPAIPQYSVNVNTSLIVVGHVIEAYSESPDGTLTGSATHTVVADDDTPGGTITMPDVEVEVAAPDTTAPYTSEHAPAKGATGVSIGTNTVVHVKDDGVGVNQSTIVMTVDGADVTPVITGSPADYTLTYDPPTDFDYEQVVDATIDAADLNTTPNVMAQDAYSFTTELAPTPTPTPSPTPTLTPSPTPSPTPTPTPPPPPPKPPWMLIIGIIIVLIIVGVVAYYYTKKR